MSFFDNLNQEVLISLIQIVIKDSHFIEYIKRFLKAGILDNKEIIPSDNGTPQGGLISPILANIYLHYVLDLWFETYIKKQTKGQCHLVRYADDFIMFFEYYEDSIYVYKEIINRYHGLSRIEDSFRIIKSDLEGRPIYVWTEEHIKAHFLICFIALTIIRIIQYKILKYENKSTLNVDGWEQGITADKIKQALNNFKACSDKNGTCLISTPDNEIENIVKSLNMEMPDLTTIDKIDKFKNIINKGAFM